MIDGGLSAILQRHIPEAHWQRIETGHGRGVPDLNYCLGGAEGWIELKSCRGWRVGMRPEQVAWAERRSRAGGRVLVAVRRGDGLRMFPGASSRLLLTEGMRRVEPLLTCLGRPASWDWEAVRWIMRHS